MLNKLFPGWGADRKKVMSIVRHVLPLSRKTQDEILRYGESTLEKKALIAGLGSGNWPSEYEVQKRLGLSVSVACLLLTIKFTSTSSEDLARTSYCATRELKKAMDPSFYAYYDSLCEWISEKFRKDSNSEYPFSELVGGWVISKTLNRQVNSADIPLALLIGMKISTECEDLKTTIIEESR